MTSQVDAYLSGLPHGVDSFPEARIKGAMVRSLADDLRTRLGRGERLHPLAQAMLDAPPPASSWVPDVKLHALYLAAEETCFSGMGGEAAFEQWIFSRTRDSLRGPLFGVLFAVLSPELVLRGLPYRWAAFHRGTSLEVLSTERSSARLRFSAAAGLMPPVAFRALRAVVRAAGVAAGASAVGATLEHVSPTTTDLVVRWAR